MNERLKTIFIALIACLAAIHAEDAVRPRYASAAIETTASNLALFGFNRWIAQAEYGMVDAESIYVNLSGGWVWDQDEFAVNQMGHPYQGSYYFTAGRSNGLSFYESTALTAAGSVFWELFMETETPSKNDLIATTFGGVALGEMFHRLYHELSPSHPHASILLSPFDFINGKSATSPYDADLSDFSVSIASGFLRTKLDLDKSRGENVETSEWSGSSDLRLEYGEAYGLDTRVPFENFEQRYRLELSNSYYSFAFFSDGFLAAWPFAVSATNRASIGTSLHYDVVFNSDVNFSANQIGLSIKNRHSFPRDIVLDVQTHLNWLVLGSTEFIYLRYGNAAPASEERRDYDLGTGLSGKLSLSFDHPRLGSIRLDYAGYDLRTIPSSVPESGSNGTTFISVIDISYERFFTKSLFAGFSLTAYRKQGSYESAPDVSDRSGGLSAFVGRKIL